MEEVQRDLYRVFHSRIDSSGRIVLPREFRVRRHLSTGDEILLIEEAGQCRLETPEQSLLAAQEYFTKLVPPGVSVVDELIAERRAEAARE